MSLQIFISFADDLCIVKVIYDENDCLSLQNDLNIVYNYCNDNMLKLNPSKSEHLRISQRICNNFQYTINNCNILSVDSHKQIGVIYDNKLCFNSHTDMIIAKALQKFGTLIYICNKVSGYTFLRLYKTYILPILEYCNLSVMYNKTQSDRIESVQTRH